MRHLISSLQEGVFRTYYILLFYVFLVFTIHNYLLWDWSVVTNALLSVKKHTPSAQHVQSCNTNNCNIMKEAFCEKKQQ